MHRRMISWVAACLPLFGCSMASDSRAANGQPTPTKLEIIIDSSTAPRIGDLARVHAAVDGARYHVIGYAWSVISPTGADASFETTSADGAAILFELAERGTYLISCRATLEGGGSLSTSAGLSVRGVDGAQLVYTARIYPPPATGAPPSEETVVVDDADRQGLIWALQDGISVTIEVADAGTPPALLPTFLRLTTKSAPSMPLDFYFADGKGTVALSGEFDALFVPDGASIAPAVLGDQRASLVAPLWSVSLDAGISVSGSVNGTKGPLGGTVVAVHSYDARTGIAVPSTIGTSTADGAFSVQARPGKARVTFAPPTTTPYPVAVVEADSLALSEPVDGWTFSFNPVKMVQLSATVLHADGSSPAESAEVLLESGPLPAVGTLASTSGTKWPAVGQVRRVLTTNAAGQLVDVELGAPQALPAGPYVLTLIPPTAAQSDGRKIVDLQLDADEHLDLQLAARGRISGTVQIPTGQPLRARVTARGLNGDFFTETDDEGRFSLSVDDQMSYSLVVRAFAADAAASRVGPLLMTNLRVTGETELGKLILPRAVALSGRVVTTGGLAIDGALIRIWCSGSGCLSSAVVDEGFSAADGSFTLRVPPP